MGAAVLSWEGQVEGILCRESWMYVKIEYKPKLLTEGGIVLRGRERPILA